VEIYGIRHGIAVDSAPTDGERWLTAKGIEKTKELARQIKKAVGGFDAIASSPLVRAQQTAQVLVGAGCSDRLEILDCLAPAGRFEDWLDWLQNYQAAHPQTQRIAIVGHAPDLGQWAELLVFGQVCNRLQVKKSGLVVLRTPAQGELTGNCELLALLPPKYWL
jgi:phosphohistidine phosphatase